MKNTIKVLGLIAMVAVIGLFIACDNDGGNGNPCSGGHTPGNVATCTTPQTCTVCSATITAATGHNYGNWLITTYPTELANGEEARTCSVCSTPETRTLTKATYQTYFYGTWTNTTGFVNGNIGWAPYTVTITADSFHFTDIDGDGFEFSDIIFTIVINTKTNTVDEFPSGFTLEGIHSQINTGYPTDQTRFIALNQDGQLLVNYYFNADNNSNQILFDKD